MELIGERWSLMIVRELLLGPRRFSDLRASLPGISAKVLTERLASLEEVGALRREKLPPPAGVQVYALTPWGLAAEPAIRELGRWAAQHSGHDPMLPLSPVSLMISMRTMMDRAAAKGLNAVIGLDVGGEQFVSLLEDGELPAIRRGNAGEGDAVRQACPPQQLHHLGVLFEPAPLCLEAKDPSILHQHEKDQHSLVTIGVELAFVLWLYLHKFLKQGTDDVDIVGQSWFFHLDSP